MTVATYTFAYQPIVDSESNTVFAYEALVRGDQAEGAATVLATVTEADKHTFDRESRARAIALAADLELRTRLSLNCLPHALLYRDDAISSTIAAAETAGLSTRQLILELTEAEIIDDAAALAAKINEYRSYGVLFAIDDFGAGYSGLNLLCDFQPDVVKLDMKLVRGVERSGPRQAIARAVVQACDDLGIEVIAEGVETEEEFHWFRRLGLRLFQGFLFGRPTFRSLAVPQLPELFRTLAGIRRAI